RSPGGGVAEGEDLATGGGDPVAGAGRGRGDADSFVVEAGGGIVVDAARGVAERLRRPEGGDGAVPAQEPTSGAVGLRGEVDRGVPIGGGGRRRRGRRPGGGRRGRPLGGGCRRRRGLLDAGGRLRGR